MSIAYVPPNVSVEQLFSPSVSPVIATGSNVCLVGVAQGYSVESQQIIVPTGTSPFVITVLNPGEIIQTVGAGKNVVSATNAIDATQGQLANFGGYAEGPSSATTSTTTTSSLSIAATVIPVTSATGFVVGQPITIDPSGTSETRTIASIASNNITISSGLSDTHLSGVAVTQTLAVATNDFSSSISSDGTFLTITPNSAGDLAVGTSGGSSVVNFVYRVSTSNYYQATRLFTQQQVESLYGPAFNNTGIQTPLSAGAFFAFQNGAGSVVLQPLFTTTTTDTVRTTTLSSATLIGATSLPVVSATGFAPGNTITIDTGGGLETRTVLTVPDGTHITVTALSNAHASGVVVSEVIVNTVKVQPSASDIANPAVWANTLVQLRDVTDIDLLVPVVGQSYPGINDPVQLSIEQAFQAHIVYQQQQGLYLMVLLGEDSSTDITQATDATLISHSTVLRSGYTGLSGVNAQESMIFISPSRYTITLPSNNSTALIIGGQYVAAAVAGLLSGGGVATSITRKLIGGFATVGVTQNKTQKNADGSAGLLVIQSSGNNIQVRHAITISNNSTAEREIGVVRSKYNMITSLVDTIDSQIIGQIVADGNAATLISTAVIGVLEALVGQGELVAYSGVQTQLLAGDPSSAQTRFSYQPAFPLNYIDIQFSLDLSGAAATTATTSSTSATT